MQSSMRSAWLALALSGLGSGPVLAGGPPEPITVPYRCDDGAAFMARLDRTSGQATVVFSGKPAMVLTIAVSGSGFRYVAGAHELRGKGDDALWLVDGAVMHHCRAESAPRN